MEPQDEFGSHTRRAVGGVDEGHPGSGLRGVRKKPEESVRQHFAEHNKDLLWQREFWRICGTENLPELKQKLAEISKQLKKEVRRELRLRRDTRITEIEQAAKRGDEARKHRLARALGGMGRGPKGRSYSAPPVQRASLAEWKRHLAQDGFHGGMAAEFVDDW